MVSSRVELCNLALTGLGANRISTLSGSDDASVICNQMYYPVLDEALRRHDWQFAIKRQALAASADTNYTGYDYMYQLPEDPKCLKVLNLLDSSYEEVARTTYPFMVEGRKLYTDYEDAILKYIARITDPSEMDSAFVWFFVEYLAFRIAFRITNDLQKEAMAEGRAKRAFDEARFQDATEGDMGNTTDMWEDAKDSYETS